MRSLITAACIAAFALVIVGGTGVVRRFVPRVVLYRLLHGEWGNPAITDSAEKPNIAQASPPTRGAGSAPIPNGVDQPASFVPYGPTSPWNHRISANPTMASYSATVIASMFGPSFVGNQEDPPVWGQEAGIYDYSHPIFFAQNSDPVIKLACSRYCGEAGTAYPTTIHIPAQARPAQGTDAHIAIVQPNGEEIDAWAAYGTPGGSGKYPGTPATRNWQTGDTLTAGNIAECRNFFTGTGFGPVANRPYSTAGGACLGGGLIRPNELLAGKINHALFIVLPCGVGASVYPTPTTGSIPDNVCKSGIGVPFGARLWYDVPDATTNASTSLATWEKAILNALHDYGGYFEDTGDGGRAAIGVQLLLADSEPGFDYTGNRSGWWQPLSAQGWTGIAIRNVQPALGNLSALRWTGAGAWLPRGVDWARHMHWLAPCSAQGRC